VSDRTLPRVASGMNAGVSMTPGGVCIRPERAAPSRAVISKRRRLGSDLTDREPTGRIESARERRHRESAY